MRYYPPCADTSPATRGHVAPRVGCKKALRRQVPRDADFTRCTRAKMFSVKAPRMALNHLNSKVENGCFWRPSHTKIYFIWQQRFEISLAQVSQNFVAAAAAWQGSVYRHVAFSACGRLLGWVSIYMILVLSTLAKILQLQASMRKDDITNIPSWLTLQYGSYWCGYICTMYDACECAVCLASSL